MYPQISATKRDDIKDRIIKSEKTLKKNIDLIKSGKTFIDKSIKVDDIER